VLVLAAPLLMRLFLATAPSTTRRWPPQRESVIDFARYCLPQVFFYGMFVLVGQILNARGSGSAR
jgi:putative peptidoglycan lipid II flippase